MTATTTIVAPRTDRPEDIRKRSNTGAAGGFRPDVQGLRAVAVVLVVLFHAGLPVPGGFVGVDVFFVISGFVITAMLQREFQLSGTIRLRRFYARRLRRLTPAFAAMVIAVIIASSLLQSPILQQESTFWTAIGAMLIAGNVSLTMTTGGYFQPDSASNPLLHTWSLAVEEQFYLLFPLAILLAWIAAKRVGSKAPVVLVAVIGGVSFLLAITTSAGVALPGPPILWNYFSPVTRSWEFAVGALVALIPLTSRYVARLAPYLGVAGGLLVVGSAFLLNGSMPYPGLATVPPVVGAALLIVAGARRQPVSALLSSRPAVFLGDVSYSWYLWHWPAIVFATLLFPDAALAAPAAAIASLLIAVVSYRLIERPTSRIALRPRTVLAIVACTVVPALVLATGALQANAKNWHSPQIADERTLHLGWSWCMSFATMANGPATNPDYTNCSWLPEATGKPIYLVGDSNASHFIEGVVGAGRALNRPVLMRTAAGCPFADVFRRAGPVITAPDVQCRAYYTATMHWLSEQTPGTVVISNAEGYWFEAGMALGADREHLSDGLASRAGAMEAGLRRAAVTLRSRGHEVLLVKPVPHANYIGANDGPQQCSVLTIETHTCTISEPRSAIDAIQASTVRSIDSAAQASGAATLDVEKHFCDAARCYVARNGDLLYQDAMHITPATSASLADDFRTALG